MYILISFEIANFLMMKIDTSKFLAISLRKSNKFHGDNRQCTSKIRL